MTQPAAWYPDPTGTHQVRYWDGTTWTDHVADAGTAAVAPVPAGAVLPPPSAAVPAAEEPGWKELLDKVGDSSRALAERARAAVAEATADDAAAGVPPAAAAQPAAAPAAPRDVGELAAQLRELGALREEGLLTDEEFAAQKARLLGTGGSPTA